MEKKDIEHLAQLSRIAVSETEAAALAGDISKILGYISEIEKVTGEKAPVKEVGALFNIMREDGAPHAAGLYTEDLLTAAPERQGQYVKVKKILADKT